MVAKEKPNNKGVRQDIDEADDEESYYKWLEENPNAGRSVDEDELDIEYDEDGNPIVPMKSKHIDPLESLDHTQIEYRPFEKSFYSEHPDILGLSPIQVIDLQQKLGIRFVIFFASLPHLIFVHFMYQPNETIFI